MDEEFAFFLDLAGFLKRWGLTKVALSLLDGAQPMVLLFSQMLLMGQAFVLTDKPSNKIAALATILEGDESVHALAEYLRIDVSAS